MSKADERLQYQINQIHAALETISNVIATQQAQINHILEGLKILYEETPEDNKPKIIV